MGDFFTDPAFEVILYILVCFMIAARRKHISRAQTCFLNVAMLNSIAEIALFLHTEFAIRARKYRLLPFYRQLPPSYLAVPMIWTTKTALAVCFVNWTISAIITVFGVIVGNPEGSFYVSLEGTLEIKYVYSGSHILADVAIILCAFTVAICTCLYVLLGYVIIESEDMGIGKGELKYLLCAVLTFSPLTIELTRSIFERYGTVSGAPVLDISKKTWIMSHDLLISVQFLTLVFVTRLHRLFIDLPFCKEECNKALDPFKEVPIMDGHLEQLFAAKRRQRHQMSIFNMLTLVIPNLSTIY
ncbi:hypothetical protein COOONC_03697 [Cooperia oncophora]